jgi:hypothetical protein
MDSQNHGAEARSTLATGSPLSGIERIDAERARQIAVEGWTHEHDDKHDLGELGTAARAYDWHADTIVKTGRVCQNPPPRWPWSRHWWKPTASPVRNWEKAGALHRAEAERCRRAGNHADAYDHDIAAQFVANKIDAFLANVKDQTRG